MALKTLVQKEWRGIARKGPYDKDELTSQMEINTEPGKGELKRLGSRLPLLDSPIPAPAIRFNNNSAYLVTETANSSTFKMFDQATNGDYQEIAFCFKFNGFEDSTFLYYLFENNKFACYYDVANSNFRFISNGSNTPAQDTILSLGTFKIDTWYWLKIWTSDGSSLNASIYENGSGTPTSDVAFYDYGAEKLQNSGGRVYLGYGLAMATESNISPISIAYFAFKKNASAGASIVEWKPEVLSTTGNDKLFFLPRDLRKSIFPAQIDSSTVQATWVLYPRPGIELTSATTLDSGDKAVGIVCGNGRSHRANLAGLELFSMRTVFMFCIDRWDQDSPHMTILRSFDNKFAIYFNGEELTVRWLPDALEADVRNGGFNYLYYDVYTSIDEFTDGGWFAIEFDPGDKGESEENALFTLYLWETNTWIAKTWETTAYWNGTGIDKPSSTDWKIGTSPQKESYLYDFRIILGDDSWTSNYSPGTALTNIPSELILWLNHDNTGYWPRDENCNTLTLTSADDINETVAITDRVTGDYKFFAENYQSDIQWDACSYLTVCYYPTPEDIKTTPAGNVYGPTDGPWYYDSTASPLVANRMAAKKKCTTVGIHKYITGGGVFQRANIPNYSIHIPNPFIDCTTGSIVDGVSSNTKPYDGDLGYDDQYKFKVTIYDPVTGNETNPHGPFWFDTAGWSAASEEGCSVSVSMFLDTTFDISHYQLRYYRYHSGTGTYRYEGVSGIARWDASTTYSEGRFGLSEFTFAISDADLALRTAIVEDNDEPPSHIYSALWAGRSWFVEAEHPSRVRFSKLYYFGNVPASYICWTDEGATGDILGMLPGFGGLLLLKENSIWIIPAADSAAGIVAQLLIPDVGVVSADAAVFVNGALWFADNSGIYVFDGQSLNQVSDKLDGLERNIWDKNPRKTRAYYDKENWKIVFTCEGTAITFDSRTGAASLCGLPEQCYGTMSSPDYSGPLYGMDGMIMKEYRGQIGLTVTNEDYNGLGPVLTTQVNSGATSGLTDITEYWVHGSHSGTHKVGYSKTGLGDVTVAFLDETGVVGQTFSQWTIDSISVTRDYDIACNIINISPTADDIYFKTRPATSLTNFFLGKIPLYYKQQFIYFGIDQNEKTAELLSVLFGDWVKTYWYNRADQSMSESAIEANDEPFCPFVTITYTADTLGEEFTSNSVTTGKVGFTEDRYLMRIPVQRKGFRGSYEMETDCDDDFPPIRSIFLYYNLIQSRGGGRR